MGPSGHHLSPPVAPADFALSVPGPALLNLLPCPPYQGHDLLTAEPPFKPLNSGDTGALTI
jgi:hypothetical protein